MNLTCTLREVRRGASVVLRPQRVTFNRGVTTVLGVNGAGKTTLFSSILGLLQPEAESIVNLGDGQTIPSSHRDQFMAALGYLPQDVPALRAMSVADFVSYAAWLKGMDRQSFDVSAVLAQVNLEERATTSMAKLSGGLRRRAGIAAALVNDPSVVILDEPTAGLDPVERRRLHHLVVATAQRRVVIVSTHLLEDARAMGSRIHVLSGGLLAEVPEPHILSDDDVVDLMQGAPVLPPREEKQNPSGARDQTEPCNDHSSCGDPT